MVWATEGHAMMVWCDNCQKEVFAYRTVPHDGGRIIRAKCHDASDEFVFRRDAMEQSKGTIVGFRLFSNGNGPLTEFPEHAKIGATDGVDKDDDVVRGTD